MRGRSNYVGAAALLTLVTGCASMRESVSGQASVMGGHESSTLDARVTLNTPIHIVESPVSVFVRDRLTVGNYDDPERLSNLAITDLLYATNGFGVFVGGRSTAAVDTGNGDSTGHIDARAGVQYGGKVVTRFGDISLFVQPSAIIDPKHPQAETVVTVGWRRAFDGPWSIAGEVETVSRFSGNGFEAATQRSRLGLGYGWLQCGLGVDLTETKGNPGPQVNAGGYFQIRF